MWNYEGVNVLDVGLLRQYAAEGLTRIEIAKRMGAPYSTTCTVLLKNSIQIPRKKHDCKKRKEAEHAEIVSLRQQGLSINEITKQTGYKRSSVVYAVREVGLGGKLDDQTLNNNYVKQIVEQAGFEYIGGYKNKKSKLTVKCKDCGSIIEKPWRQIRDFASGKGASQGWCKHCYSRTHSKERDRKQAQHERAEREAQIRAQRKAEQLSRKASNQLARRLAIHVCKNCGEEYCTAVTGYNSSSYCSKKCQQRWHDRVKNDNRMDRMLRREHDTDITLDKLFKRDGGVCYLCGNMCDWSDIEEKNGAMVAGDNYPSIDHVKPVSKGGTHTWDNIKLACRRCNTLKGWK